MDAILKDLVTPKSGSPDINGLVAGWTNASSTQYLEAYGVKNLETQQPVSVDTPMALFSFTKSMTGMAMMKLWEDGRVDLDYPAKMYLPALGDLGLIDEDLVDFETGKFTKPLRKPKTDVTVRHLLLHTAGFAYMFTDARYLALQKRLRISGANPTHRLFTSAGTPLLAEPGSQWIYGHATDWAGFVIEAITGMKLSQFLQQEIFSKAGITSFTFQMDRRQDMMALHRRVGNDLKILSRWPLTFCPEMDMGGQGCFGTVGDYLRFLRIWLNYGVSPDTGIRILRRETVEYAIQNHLPEGFGVEFPTAVNQDPDYKPDGFTMAGCAYNHTDLPTGRPKGLLYWSGLANLFFWLDFDNGVAGVFACQVMPYMDEKCNQGYLRFERAVYDEVKRKEHL